MHAAQDERRFRVPLSLGQEELWKVLQRWPATETLFHDTIRVSIPWPADRDLVMAVIGRLVERHELLRTTFRTDEEGRPYQSIAPTATVPELAIVDLTGLAPSERQAELLHLVAAQHAQTFDLAEGPLFRVGLVATGTESSVLVITTEHLISDIATEAILAAEITELYRALVRGEQPSLSAVPIQYADFAVWQRRILAERGVDAERRWWLRTLDGMPLDTPLPHDRPPSPTGSKRTSCVEFPISASVHAAVRKLCREARSTPYIVTVAAVQALVAQYTGRSDIVVLTSVNGRDRPELQGVVGPIANGALLRAEFSNDPSVGVMLERAREAVLGMFAHQHLPLEQVVEALVGHLKAEGVKAHPQVPVSVEFFHAGPRNGLQGGSLPEPPLAQRHVGAESADVKDIFNPLAFRLFATPEHMWGRLAYHEAVFDRATAERLVAEFKAVLAAVAHDRHLRLSELPPVGLAHASASAHR